MFDIYLEDHFDAAHYLRGYDGPCRNLHGHRYKTGLTFRFDARDASGMAFDFTVAKEIIGRTLKLLDHTCLNDLEPFAEANPTAENIAFYIYGSVKKDLPALYSVSVWESPTACATYYE